MDVLDIGSRASQTISSEWLRKIGFRIVIDLARFWEGVCSRRHRNIPPTTPPIRPPRPAMPPRACRSTSVALQLTRTRLGTIAGAPLAGEHLVMRQIFASHSACGKALFEMLAHPAAV